MIRPQGGRSDRAAVVAMLTQVYADSRIYREQLTQNAELLRRFAEDIDHPDVESLLQAFEATLDKAGSPAVLQAWAQKVNNDIDAILKASGVGR